jgi:hypothetical protein
VAVFPKVERQCPYKDRRAAAMDGDICRICDHQVIDLTGWSDEERIAFAAGQKEAVCISYRVPLRPALAAAALAAAALPNMAAAQDPAAPPAAQAPADEPESNEIVGIFGPARAAEGPKLTVFDSAEAPAAKPEALVTHEDDRPAETPAPPADPKS